MCCYELAEGLIRAKDVIETISNLLFLARFNPQFLRALLLFRFNLCLLSRSEFSRCSCPATLF